MPRRLVRLAPSAAADGEALRAAFADIRDELQVPTDFPAEVLAEADRAAEQFHSSLPGPRRDATDIAFVTIDPPGSTDLDQAVALSRTASGFLVRYAIADVAAFVAPGGAVDREAHRRVETLYAPDGRTPLHPPVLSEGAASLLPGQVRPALLWEIELDAEGERTGVRVERAAVRSRQQLAYEDVGPLLAGGDPPEWAVLLREIGMLREQRELDRGGVSLPIPEQDVVAEGDGYRLQQRRPLPAEGWNAQISLLTGMASAALALEAGVGILRTLPGPTPGALQRLRRTAEGLGVAWADDVGYPGLVRTLDPTVPVHAALLQEATGLMRGAGYTVLSPGLGAADVTHGAIAAPYAHTTAPLRRLVDRYAGEVAVSVSAGTPVPEWTLAALDALPQEMASGDQRAGALERAYVDLGEAAALADRVGEEFEAVVVDVTNTGATVTLVDPPVRGRCDGAGQPLGQRVRVRLTEASIERRTVRFVPA